EIRDYISGKLDYEIYSYGEQTVVIPIEKKERKIIWQYAAESVRDYFKTYDQNNVVQFVSDNEIRVYLMNETIPKVIGKNGEEIKKIEQELGLKIDVLPLSKIQIKKPDKQINFEIDLDKRNVLIYLEKELKDTQIGIYEDEQLLVQAKTSKKAVIKLSRKSIPGMAVERAFLQNKIKMVKV
ncbi:MAG: KH domain-containing protein, partial [Nanoarchaeota archaeon]|nr:KH domain-containing protein [Nanoarchaeota archaeon]